MTIITNTVKVYQFLEDDVKTFVDISEADMSDVDPVATYISPLENKIINLTFEWNWRKI